MLTTRESLNRQSWLVAGLCMVADGAEALLSGGELTVGHWLLVAGTVLVNAALAAPPQLSGVVALVHAHAAPLLQQEPLDVLAADERPAVRLQDRHQRVGESPGPAARNRLSVLLDRLLE